MLVLDASVALAWAFVDEPSRLAEVVFDRLASDEALVPPIWSYEVANGLIRGERRDRLSRAESARFVEVVAGLPISTADADGPAAAFGPVSDVARQIGLSAYDASYLDLALRRGLPLATLDRRLETAAARLGVPVVGADPGGQAR